MWNRGFQPFSSCRCQSTSWTANPGTQPVDNLCMQQLIKISTHSKIISSPWFSSVWVNAVPVLRCRVCPKSAGMCDKRVYHHQNLRK